VNSDWNSVSFCNNDSEISLRVINPAH
jgi:hypothetical protein